MKTLSFAAAAFAVAAFMGVQAPELAAASSGPQVAQSKKQNVKKLQVRRATDIQRTFHLAAQQRQTHAVEIGCSPPSSEWCTKDFVTACDDNKGGMSTDGDGGGVTCSLPD